MGGYSFPHKDDGGLGLLEETGPLIEVDISAPIDLQEYLAENGLPPFSTRSGYALIDTGAYSSAVDESIFRELEILVVDATDTLTPHGWGRSNMFNAAASFPSLGLYQVPLDLVLGCHIRTQTRAGQDVIMLLGRDILRNFVMVYDGPHSSVTIHR